MEKAKAKLRITSLETEYKPRLYNGSIQEEHDALVALMNSEAIISIVDTYADQARELELVRDSSKIGQLPPLPSRQELGEIEKGMWVYYPWKKTLVHVLNENEYEELRTSRNKNLITKDEQDKFRNARIAVAGLNVGNPGALCIVLEGGSKNIKFADFDPLSVSNLNRFRAGLCELEINKATLSARQALEIDPYMNIEVYEKGITPENINNFLTDPKVDLIIEEMDNLKLKILMRDKAREFRVPLIMVTGNSENVIIDVERYDIDTDLLVLNGYLKQEVIDSINNINKDATLTDRVLLARDFIGKDFLTQRLQQSFLEVGKSLASIPQLSESSFLRGAVLGYVARQILTGEQMPSGRFSVNLSDIAK